MKPTDVCCIYILYKKCKQQIFSIYISPDRAVKHHKDIYSLIIKGNRCQE